MAWCFEHECFGEACNFLHVNILPNILPRDSDKQPEALRDLLEAAKSAVRTLEVACFDGDAEILRQAIRRYEEAQRG